jgi:hypothetical protein
VAIVPSLYLAVYWHRFSAAFSSASPSVASVSLAGAAFFSAAGFLLLTVRPSSLGDPHHSLKAVLFLEADGTHPGRTLVDAKSCSRRLGVDLY